MKVNRSTLVNALRVAEIEYMACSGLDNGPRLAEQFRRQSREAAELATAIEQADTIELTD